MYEKESLSKVCKILNTDLKSGLTSIEAKERLEKNGLNELLEKKARSKFIIFLSQFNNPMIYILFAAVLISLFLKEYSDFLIILFVIFINAIIGMAQEAKAEQALKELKRLNNTHALVRRDGQILNVESSELVLGDIVILEAGRTVPADLRLSLTANLKIEEAALTGESIPVEKHSSYLATGKESLGDRKNIAYSLTNVAYGRGEGIVVATAMETEIGKIAGLINRTKSSLTPLQKKLASLGKMLGILAVIICLAMFLITVLQNRNTPEMLFTAISLAVAAIPEGLPAVVTIVLALGVQRMVKVNAIIRNLPSVETLGAVSVVCSDKTGTLTQNKLTVTKIYVNQNFADIPCITLKNSEIFINGFALCNDASINGGQRIGDPTELALLDLADKFEVSREKLEKYFPRIDEEAFDSKRKMMTTVHKNPKGIDLSFTKGAVDSLLPRCDKILVDGNMRKINGDDIKKIENAVASMASMALRVLALAVKNGCEKTEENLTFIGMVGMMDPPRQEAGESIKAFKSAGIRTVMITGDHKETAFAIAKNLGLVEDIAECMSSDELSNITQEELNEKVEDLRVFARVSPEHKVMIVNAFKSRGYVVSMTGDGVNDAPSLKAADIGVAMGITGTDVAKGAADMVLTDDNFSTIEKAVEEGRCIYENIKKSVVFLLSSNLGEVISMFLAIVIGLASPLRAVHILWVNLITDTFPGLALGVDKKDRDIMKKPPRGAGEGIFSNGGLFITIFYGIVISIITLCGFLSIPVSNLWSLGLKVNLANIVSELSNHDVLIRSQTYAFMILGISQLFHAVGMRNINKSIFKMNHLENKTMIFGVVFALFLQILVTEVPLLNTFFKTVSLSLNEWICLILVSIVPLIFHEILILCNIVSNRIGRNFVNMGF